MAKRRRKTGSRKTATYKGVTIVLPKGATKLTTAHKSKIDAAKGPSGRKTCRGVFFSANKFAFRCEGRSLSTSAKRRFRDSGGKRSCMKKAGKKLLFKSC